MAEISTERRPPHLSDEELARRLGTGDDASFDELYRRYAHPLTDFATRRLRDRAAGEDVAQTTLLSALTAIRRGSRPEHVRAWLYRIAEHAAFEAHRKRGDIASDGREESRDDAHDTPFERAALLAGVREMPPRQRDVYVLRELHGLPLGEVADRLDLTARQVEQALFMARNRLSEQLVFGERLTCERLRTLELGRLEPSQRRAVKSHLRSCPACRGAVGRRGLGLPSLGSLLRNLVELLPGGAAPVAAKVGAIAATAALAGGAPLAARTVVHELSHTPAAHAAIVPAAAASAPLALEQLVTPAFLRAPAPRTASPSASARLQPSRTSRGDAPAPTATAGATQDDASATDEESTDTSGDGADAADAAATDETEPTADEGDTATDPADDPTDTTASEPDAVDDPAAAEPDATDPAITETVATDPLPTATTP